MNEQKLARGLGLFSVGLGLTELFGARRLGRALGLEGREGLIRAFGVREIITGIGILASPFDHKNTGRWIWGRVAGDVLDLIVLGSRLGANNPKRGGAAFATANVAAVSALDVLCGRQLTA
jgi:hypothetical protein